MQLISETRWVVRTGIDVKYDSALEEADDELARYAGYSVKKPCSICFAARKVGWHHGRIIPLVPSRTGVFFIQKMPRP